MADIKKPTTTSGSKRAATPAKSAVKAAVKPAVKR
jgi:hypothetical protein